ncbi:hypothetical protein Taro_002938 [Colocasia esculenta]|uniref:CCHC-type domain-containing protein n=1 Tax=Colocasia esculenta TaxID=4460 RepID=A0A843TFN0_COLES|nr:hypothetical protein [Colocasia esculenta]
MGIRKSDALCSHNEGMHLPSSSTVMSCVFRILTDHVCIGCGGHCEASVVCAGLGIPEVSAQGFCEVDGRRSWRQHRLTPVVFRSRQTKFEMDDRRDWGGGGDDPEEITQRMIERIWESLMDIRARMDQQAQVPPVAVPHGDGETVPIAPVPPGVEVPFVAPLPPPPPVLLAEEPVMQVEKFLRLQPPTYSGGPNPDTTEHWVHEIERVFATMRCPATDKVVLAAYQLRGFALECWRLKMQTTFAGRTEEVITWSEFLDVFNDTFFPIQVQQVKREQFRTLQQGNSSVLEYQMRFMALSRYAPYVVSDNNMMVEYFIRGLRVELQDAIVPLMCKTVEEAVQRAAMLERSIRTRQKFEMSDRRDWGGGGDDPEEGTQRMIERIWESLTDIQARMDQQAPVPPVAVPPGDGETVPIAPVPPGVEVPFVAPLPPPPPVLLAEEPVMQVEKFLRLQPPTYSGGPILDTAEHWVHEIERVGESGSGSFWLPQQSVGASKGKAPAGPSSSGFGKWGQKLKQAFKGKGRGWGGRQQFQQGRGRPEVEESQQSTARQPIIPPGYRCYNCNQPRHLIRNCPYPREYGYGRGVQQQQQPQ